MRGEPNEQLFPRQVVIQLPKLQKTTGGFTPFLTVDKLHPGLRCISKTYEPKRANSNDLIATYFVRTGHWINKLMDIRSHVVQIKVQIHGQFFFAKFLTPCNLFC